MSEADNYQIILETLKEYLEKNLQAKPIEINCFFRKDLPIFLIHYSESVVPNPKEVFSLLKQALKQEGFPEDYPVSMYLVWQESDRVDFLQRLLVTETKISDENFKNTQKPRKFAFAGLITGIAIVSLFCGYIFSRPCVIGKCQAISEAKEAMQMAFIQVNTSASDGNILSAQQELNKAIATLKSIPVWSNSRPQAEKLLKDAQEQSQNLNKIVNAIQIGQKANSVTEITESQSLWQEAIATLETIPSKSHWKTVAQFKIQQYQKNLVELQQQQTDRQNAIAYLKKAQETAKLAQNRENDAQSLSDWQLVSATWQTSLQQLREISPQTKEYQQAKELLEAYVPRLVSARKRKQQEEVATNIYQKATEQAKIAQNAESKNQWLAAVTNWRNALNFIQQVPKNTFQYRQAEPLIATYLLALNRANEFSQANSILEKICLENSQCNYTIADNVIKLNLTSDYIQKLWETVLQARATGNWQTEAQLRDRIALLEKNLQSLGNNSGKRVEVYNSDGRLMMVYEVNRH
jgi:tetratricopeptide (TPR) repeat protein